VDTLWRAGNAVSFLDSSAAQHAPHDLGAEALKQRVHMDDHGRPDGRLPAKSALGCLCTSACPPAAPLIRALQMCVRARLATRFS